MLKSQHLLYLLLDVNVLQRLHLMGFTAFHVLQELKTVPMILLKVLLISCHAQIPIYTKNINTLKAVDVKLMVK